LVSILNNDVLPTIGRPMIPVFIKGLSLMEEATARGVHGLLKKTVGLRARRSTIHHTTAVKPSSVEKTFPSRGTSAL
jgi:hypothetical protein